MKQTKGAIGNLLNRYRAVLKKCHLLNTFGSLAVAGMLVMGGVGLASATTLISEDTSYSDQSFTEQNGTSGGAFNVNQNAGLILDNVSFTDNTATTYGGAIYSGGTLTITNSTFTNNIAGSVGGALSNGTDSTGLVTISGSTFTNNHSVYDGGAIGNYSGLVITDSIFEGNTAQLAQDENGQWTVATDDSLPVGGGAISLGAVSETAVASISNTIFRNNISGKQGGAIGTRLGQNADNSAAKLDIAATFIGNRAQQGGAIYNTFYTNNGLGKGDGVTVTGLFSGNEASDKGGAIFNDGAVDKSGARGGVMTITDASFDHNTATVAGGAIYNTGTLKLNAGSFTENSAANGGAIYNNGGTVEVNNGTVFDKNTATAQNYGGGAIYSNGGTVNIGGNVTFSNNYLNQPVSVSDDKEMRSVGGAIAAWGSTKLTIGNNATFTNNGYNSETGEIAWSAGGAIYLDTDKSTLAEMTIGEGANFTGNVAGALGGAIYAADSKTTITSAQFDSNRAGMWGGAIFVGKYYDNIEGDMVSLSDSTFTDNQAGSYGGAIAIDRGNVTISGSTFTGNTVTNEDGLGGAIYNNGTLTFEGSNSFSDNTAGGQANDIHNVGKITVQSGTTTLYSGLAQAGTGEITISGGMLDMASGSTLSFANESKLTIDGGTFVADLGQLLTDYKTTNTANGISDTNIVGTKGNLNLRLNGGSYTAEDYSDAKKALLGQENEGAVLNFLNANLELDESKGEELVVGAESADSTVTISNATPSVAAENEAPSEGTAIPSVPTEIVSVVSNDASKTLLSADTVTVQNSTFTAKGLKIEGSATEGNAVTVKIDGTSNITLAGGESGFTGVLDAENRSVATNVEVTSNAALTVGLVGNDAAQNLTMNDVQVKGSFSVEGNGLDTTRVTAQTFDVSTETAAVSVDNATLSVEKTSISNGQLDVINSVADLGTVNASGGVLFFDPSYGNIDSLENGTLASRLVVSNGSVVNLASGLNNLQELAQSAGFTTKPQGNGEFFLGEGQSMLAIGQAITVANDTTTQGVGQIVVDGTVEMNSDDRPTIDGQAITNTAYFGNNSLLVVNGNVINGDTAAITFGKVGSLNVQNGAKLLIADAVAGTTYKVIDNANAAHFGDTNIAYTDDSVTGWKGANLLTSSDMITLTSTDGMVFTSKREDAQEIFPSLSGEMADLVNELYTGREPDANHATRWDYADVNSPDMGVRFLSRATGNGYLGKDKQAAAATIESAARMAFAGAVPQMTKMASDSATNSVVNRMGFANPENGAKAMNVDGKLVDDKALGLALWIAPLWSNQTGFGMEAGNLDYGYNANIGGISLGADYTWANNFRAGLMFNIGGGYAESSGDLSETTNSMTFWGVGAYGGWKYENFAVMGDVSYTSTWNSVDQDVDHRMGMGDLEADIQASAISAGLRFEYKLETQYLDLIPHVGARYMSINTWGYDVETNGGTVLEGDGFQQNIWTFPVGITFSKELEMNNDWYFKPSVDFTVIPAAGDIKAKEDVRFTGLPYSTEIETQMMDYFTWQGGLGLEFGNDNMSVGVNYTLQAGQNSTGHGVFGMFRYEF